MQLSWLGRGAFELKLYVDIIWNSRKQQQALQAATYE